MVLVIHEERKLGRVVHVKPGDDKNGPVTVTLEPLATIAGRVTDADGNPVSGATIRTDPLPGGDFSLQPGEQVALRSEGEVRRPQRADRLRLRAWWSRAGSRATRVTRFAFARDVAVRPGETTDVGEIQFKKD